MRKPLLIVLLTLLMAVNVFNQNNKDSKDVSTSDFNGTWILDKEKSLFEIRVGRRNPNESDKENLADYILTISQKESEFKIKRSFTFKGKQWDYETALFTDKRGEENTYIFKQYAYRLTEIETFWLEDANIKSKSQLKEAKLTRSGSFISKSGKAHIVKEIYELSKDGKTLSVLTDIQVMYSPKAVDNRKSKLIFQKQES